jgi:polyisoprenoid-binding protein YceI
MKHSISHCASLTIALVALAGFVLPMLDVMTFSPDKAHSQVGFQVRHLGISNVRGSFNEYDAKVTFDPADLSTLQVEATVNIASIDTGIERRDTHLKSDDFFNAESFPTLSFKSKGVRNLEGTTFELVGDLTIRDVTKEVVLDSEFLGLGKQRETTKAGFSASTTINRFDYNLKWDRLTEAGGLVVSEEVKILLELELDQVAQTAP